MFELIVSVVEIMVFLIYHQFSSYQYDVSDVHERTVIGVQFKFNEQGESFDVDPSSGGDLESFDID